MLVHITEHYQVPTKDGWRYKRSEHEDLDPSESVGAFKARYAKQISMEADKVNVLYGNKLRSDDQTLGEDGEFRPNAPNSQCHIHLQICNFLLEGKSNRSLEDFIIPRDEVWRKPQDTSASTAAIETKEFLGKWSEVPVSYSTRDLLLYAISIGEEKRNFTYEHDEKFEAFPTYPLVLAFKGTDRDVVNFPSAAMMAGPESPPLGGNLLDGERYIEMVKPLRTDGAELSLKSRLTSIIKRKTLSGSQASIQTESELVGADGDVYYKLRSTAFLVDADDFVGSGKSINIKVFPPERPPDKVVESVTTEHQAALYRLSGDYNPLHIDPDPAKVAGFENPILHGLCTLGVSCRTVLDTYAAGDASQFKAINVRFAKPVMPGQTLVLDMWKEENRIIFIAKVKETGDVVLSNAYLDLVQ